MQSTAVCFRRRVTLPILTAFISDIRYIFVSSKKNNKIMKNEIIYKNRTIIENTDGTFSAFYSNYSSYLVKTFKTLAAAKKQIDKWA